MNTETNSLSAVLRLAWDSGLSTLTRNNPLRATGAHVSVVCHITEAELRRHLTATEMANGFANRFLWLLTRRSKPLPEGEAVPESSLAPLIEELCHVVNVARQLGQIRRDEESREMWAQIYPSLSDGEEGLVGVQVRGPNLNLCFSHGHVFTKCLSSFARTATSKTARHSSRPR